MLKIHPIQSGQGGTFIFFRTVWTDKSCIDRYVLYLSKKHLPESVAIISGTDIDWHYKDGEGPPTWSINHCEHPVKSILLYHGHRL